MSLAFHRYGNVGFLFLRLVVGGIFIYHGYMKWSMWTAPTAQLPATMVMLFKLLAIAEPLGGVALILGVVTEFAALGLTIVMASAIYMKITTMHVAFSSGTTTGWEFDLVLLAACVFLFLNGGGTLALQQLDE